MRSKQEVRARLERLLGQPGGLSPFLDARAQGELSALKWVLSDMPMRTIEDLLDRWDRHTVTNNTTGEQVSSPIYSFSELGLDNNDMREFLDDPFLFREKVKKALEREMRQLNEEDAEHAD